MMEDGNDENPGSLGLKVKIDRIGKPLYPGNLEVACGFGKARRILFRTFDRFPDRFRKLQTEAIFAPVIPIRRVLSLLDRDRMKRESYWGRLLADSRIR